jgi:hypothetical protein
MLDDAKFRIIRLKQAWAEWESAMAKATFTPSEAEAFQKFAICFAELAGIVAKEEGAIVYRL